MNLFRITDTAFKNDLTGNGSRIHGGRWNKKGTSLIYTSESRALAALEYLVRLQPYTVPTPISILQIQAPKNASIETISAKSLPANWDSYPSPEILKEKGSEWAQSLRTLLLKVPSAIIDDEFNILINPNHPDFKSLIIKEANPFIYDDRLLKK